MKSGFSFFAVLVAAALSAGVYLSSQYMQNFWQNKAKVPLMDEYNSAITDTLNVISLSTVVAIGWGFVAVLKLTGQ